MEGMLAWERPHCEPFRDLLVHAQLQPYLNELLGGGYRLDHGPLLIAMDKGDSGHLLHGGVGRRRHPPKNLGGREMGLRAGTSRSRPVLHP